MGGVKLSGTEDGRNTAALGAGVVTLAGQAAGPELIAQAPPFAKEFDAALAGLVAALEQAGSAPAALLHLRIYVTDLAVYADARPAVADVYRERLGDHHPAATVVEVPSLLGGGQVEIEGVAVAPSASASPSLAATDRDDDDAVIRLRLAPSDARYAPNIAAGSKAMEIFADLETELALREGGDEGLCVAYDMVEFLAPLRTGDFVEGRARVVSRGRTSRRIAAEIYKVLEVDEDGILLPADAPVLAARASVTIVVGRTPRTGGL